MALILLDLEPMTVLSVGLVGRRGKEAIRFARGWIEEQMEGEGWTAAGPWRTLGYKSPIVPSSKRFWELQIPVTRD